MTHHISIEDAKKLVAGPLGSEMAKFPLRFAKPTFFGDIPRNNTSAKINNGTVSLINFGDGPLAITCFHVLTPYKDKIGKGEKCLFQIGACRLDPLKQLISESEELDIAVIRLTEKQANEITNDDMIGSSFFQPTSWPPQPILKDEYVIFGGFPGKWRTQLATAALEFGTYSSGGSRVVTIGDTYFITQFERECWIQTLGAKDAINLTEIGGLSGGPAFVSRGLRFDFVGIIYQFSSNFELLYFRHSNILKSDGQINNV